MDKRHLFSPYLALYGFGRLWLALVGFVLLYIVFGRLWLALVGFVLLYIVLGRLWLASASFIRIYMDSQHLVYNPSDVIRRCLLTGPIPQENNTAGHSKMLLLTLSFFSIGQRSM
ncbi:MAG: hypothetical protein LUC83_05230 [Clostridiales bacterium]|nr:hypothetical protein [Clostridiales bacterium]